MHHRGSLHAPPPPLLRTGRGPGGGESARMKARSRSRSRSPPRGSGSGGGRYGGRSDRDSSRDLRERTDRDRRDRDRGGDRDRRRSISPYGGGGGASSSRDRDRDRDRERKSSSSAATTLIASKSSSTTAASAVVDAVSVPAISIIHPDPLASIVRRILNPEDVRIPRRVKEGIKPIFDRQELKEAMLRRMQSNDNEDNPVQSNAYIQDPAVTQQRVVAIIREPVGGSSLDMYLASKDPAFRHAVKLEGTGAGPPPAAFGRRSPTPPRTVSVRPGAGSRRQDLLPRGSSPPPSHSSRARSVEREQRERERLILERERALEREREQLLREREQHNRELLPRPEREREFRGERDERSEREREGRASRFNPIGSGPPPSIHQRIDMRQRIRSRSPVTRVLREDGRLQQRRRSRSHSVTPPPMPDEFRRQLIMERQKQMDLRNSLSRQPGKIGDDRAKGRPGPPLNPRGGRGGGRGGFHTRPVRGREDERRAWVHDMYDGGGDEPKKG